MLNEKNSNVTSSKASIIVEFIVYTNEEYLSNLLKNLSNNNLNISAYYISENNKTLKFVFIVGGDDTQSPNDVNIARGILKQNKLKFEERKVVRLKAYNDIGLLAYHYKELIKTLTVYNSYIAEDGSIIYETCCPTKTLAVLNELS